eukprot:tig00001310_g8159.t1
MMNDRRGLGAGRSQGPGSEGTFGPRGGGGGSRGGLEFTQVVPKFLQNIMAGQEAAGRAPPKRTRPPEDYDRSDDEGEAPVVVGAEELNMDKRMMKEIAGAGGRILASSEIPDDVKASAKHKKDADRDSEEEGGGKRARGEAGGADGEGEEEPAEPGKFVFRKPTGKKKDEKVGAWRKHAGGEGKDEKEKEEKGGKEEGAKEKPAGAAAGAAKPKAPAKTLLSFAEDDG